MVKIEKVPDAPKKLSFDFTEALESGNDVLTVTKLSKSYGEKNIFSDLSFEVKKNDRLVIIGSNGSGKSTLLQILAGKIGASAGRFEYGYNVREGYYDQNLHLNEDLTVLEEVWNESDLDHTRVRALLDTFLFRGDDVFKEIKVLSGGERARVELAKLMQKKINLLLLDEPTNHLDIESREALEEAVENFGGTVIAVSHDRYFINRLAKRILAFDFDGEKTSAFLYEGDYAHYLEYRGKTSKAVTREKAETKDGAEKSEFERRKKSKQERQKAEKKKTVIETSMRKNDEEAKALTARAEEYGSDYVELQKIYERQEEIKKENDKLFEEWCALDAFLSEE